MEALAAAISISPWPVREKSRARTLLFLAREPMGSTATAWQRARWLTEPRWNAPKLAASMPPQPWRALMLILFSTFSATQSSRAPRATICATCESCWRIEPAGCLDDSRGASANKKQHIKPSGQASHRLLSRFRHMRKRCFLLLQHLLLCHVANVCCQRPLVSERIDDLPVAISPKSVH